MPVSVYTLNSGSKINSIHFPSDIRTMDDVTKLLPDGVYSTFRTFANTRKVLDLKSHFNRLFTSCDTLGIKPSATAEEVREALRNLRDFYHPGEARIRICLSLTDQIGQIYLMLEPLSLIPEDVYQNGVRTITSKFRRTNPRLKSTEFIQKSTQDRLLIQKLGVYEALMVHDGRIFEGMTSNFYAGKDSQIITARSGILLGVTRSVVLRLLRDIGIPVDYRSLRIDELPEIDEAFISSSSRGIVPVVEIDGTLIGQGVPGYCAKELRVYYDKFIIDNAEEI